MSLVSTNLVKSWPYAQDLFPFKSRELSYSYIHEIKQRGMHGPQFTACKSGIASDHPLGVSQCIVRRIQYGATDCVLYSVL